MTRAHLAIVAPTIDSLSETFILRHMRDLLPCQTVVVSGVEEGVGLDESVPRLLVGAGYSAGRGAAVTQFLRRHHIDVAMGEYLTWSHQWIEAVRSAGSRYFVHAHGYDVSRTLRDPAWRSRYMDYDRADGLITVSDGTRRRLIELGLQGERIHVIPCGVDVPPQPPTRPERDVVRCVAVGRMVGKKAPLTTLEAFRLAAARCGRLRLDMIGDGPLFDAAQQYVARVHLGDRVRLLGPQSHAAVLHALREADVFVQHSLTDPVTGDEEGLPVSILEAMAQALPVVSTRHAGIPEAVLDGVTGLLVDEGSVAAMADHLVTLGTDARARTQLGAAGWRHVEKSFSWERERASLSQLLGLESPGRGRSVAAASAPATMPSTSLVTVVVPAYNRAATIERCIASVRAQTYPHWEIVVVDDGSTDATREVTRAVAGEDPRIRLVEHRERRGAQAARNTGIREGRGEWIAFLDSDDEFLPHSLESRLHRAIEEGREVVHSACRVRKSDGSLHAYRVPRLSGRVYGQLLRHEGPVFPGLLVKRTALERIGLLDEQITAFQEWDTSIRLASAFEFSFEPRPTFIYDCTGADAMSKDFIRNGRAYEQVVGKHFLEILRHAGPTAVAHHHRQAQRWYEMAGADGLARRSRRRARLWACLDPALLWSKIRAVRRFGAAVW